MNGTPTTPGRRGRRLWPPVTLNETRAVPSVTGAANVTVGELILVFAAALMFLFVLHFREGTFIYTLSQQEGGVWIDEAVRTLRGELVYRDFFEFLTPGVIYVNAAFLALLGPHTTSIGIMVVILGALGTLAVHALSAAILDPPWRFVPAPIFVILTYASYSPGNHKWPTVILCLASLLLVVRRRTRLRCALAGVAIGGATLCTQDFGVGAALGMAAALWLLRTREHGAQPVAFLTAYCGTVVLVLLTFAAAAGPAKVWFAIVTVPLVLYPKAEQHFVFGLGGPRNFPLWMTAFGLGGCGLLYATLGIFRRFWRTDPVPVVIVALTGTGLMAVGGLAHPIEPTQVGVRAVPLTIVALFAIAQGVAAYGVQRSARRALVVLGALLAFYGAARLVRRQFDGTMSRESHRAGAIWVARPLHDLTWLEANTVEGQPVFMFPDKGGLYFLSRTRNATSYPVLFDQSFSPEAHVARAVRQIATTCPAVGIWDRTRLASFVMKRPDWYTLEPLYRAIRRDYDITELPNGAFGLRRKTACATVGRESR